MGAIYRESISESLMRLLRDSPALRFANRSVSGSLAVCGWHLVDVQQCVAVQSQNLSSLQVLLETGGGLRAGNWPSHAETWLLLWTKGEVWQEMKWRRTRYAKALLIAYVDCHFSFLFFECLKQAFHSFLKLEAVGLELKLASRTPLPYRISH